MFTTYTILRTLRAWWHSLFIINLWQNYYHYILRWGDRDPEGLNSLPKIASFQVQGLDWKLQTWLQGCTCRTKLGCLGRPSWEQVQRALPCGRVLAPTRCLQSAGVGGGVLHWSTCHLDVAKYWADSGCRGQMPSLSVTRSRLHVGPGAVEHSKGTHSLCAWLCPCVTPRHSDCRRAFLRGTVLSLAWLYLSHIFTQFLCIN